MYRANSRKPLIISTHKDSRNLLITYPNNKLNYTLTTRKLISSRMHVEKAFISENFSMSTFQRPLAFHESLIMSSRYNIHTLYLIELSLSDAFYLYGFQHFTWNARQAKLMAEQKARHGAKSVVSSK